MTNVELREKIGMVLDDMKAKAIEMCIQGVATASILNKGETVDWIGEMKVVGTPLDTKGGFNRPIAHFAGFDLTQMPIFTSVSRVSNVSEHKSTVENAQ